MADTLTILCTFPGKFGDLLWALPSVRAVSVAIGGPVDLVITGACGSIVPLLQQQDYLGTVWADPTWVTQDTAPISPRTPSGFDRFDGETRDYDRVLHLGYRGWPDHALPYETERCLWAEWPAGWLGLGPIDLSRPWITPPSWAANLAPIDYAEGWTDEHCELKVGVHQLLWRRAHVEAPTWHGVDVSSGPRWIAEYQQRPADYVVKSWNHAAAWISRAAVFLGDCSALHVLACALGVPCVLMEPNEARHHKIFWPYGKEGPQVTQVVGVDGRWTWDARHVWETVQAVGKRRVLEGVPQ